MRKVRRVVIHHSASQRSTTAAEIREWHRAKGWLDIGYHWVVEGDGAIVRGRPFHQVGAHAKGANSDSLGVCIVGDNTKPEERWSKDQVLGASRLLQAIAIVFGPLEVVPHFLAGTTATQCPGFSEAEWHAQTFPLAALVGELPIVRGAADRG